MILDPALDLIGAQLRLRIQIGAEGGKNIILQHNFSGQGAIILPSKQRAMHKYV